MGARALRSLTLPLLEAYEPGRHRAEIQGWWEARGSKPDPSWRLPPVGYVARAIDGTGLAAAFLLEPRGYEVCQIHEMVSNPAALKRDVNQALDLIVTSLEDEAKRLGYRGAWAVTESWPVAARMQRHGWLVKERRVTVIVKAL